MKRTKFSEEQHNIKNSYISNSRIGRLECLHRKVLRAQRRLEKGESIETILRYLQDLKNQLSEY